MLFRICSLLFFFSVIVYHHCLTKFLFSAKALAAAFYKLMEIPPAFLEAVAEIVLVRISAFAAYLFQRKTCRGQITAGAFNPERCDGVADTLSRDFFEKRAQVSRRDICMLCDVVEAKAAVFKFSFIYPIATLYT